MRITGSRRFETTIFCLLLFLFYFSLTRLHSSRSHCSLEGAPRVPLDIFPLFFRARAGKETMGRAKKNQVCMYFNNPHIKPGAPYHGRELFPAAAYHSFYIFFFVSFLPPLRPLPHIKRPNAHTVCDRFLRPFSVCSLVLLFSCCFATRRSPLDLRSPLQNDGGHPVWNQCGTRRQTMWICVYTYTHIHANRHIHTHKSITISIHLSSHPRAHEMEMKTRKQSLSSLCRFSSTLRACAASSKATFRKCHVALAQHYAGEQDFSKNVFSLPCLRPFAHKISIFSSCFAFLAAPRASFSPFTPSPTSLPPFLLPLVFAHYILHFSLPCLTILNAKCRPLSPSSPSSLSFSPFLRDVLHPLSHLCCFVHADFPTAKTLVLFRGTSPTHIPSLNLQTNNNSGRQYIGARGSRKSNLPLQILLSAHTNANTPTHSSTPWPRLHALLPFENITQKANTVSHCY